MHSIININTDYGIVREKKGRRGVGKRRGMVGEGEGRGRVGGIGEDRTLHETR